MAETDNPNNPMSAEPRPEGCCCSRCEGPRGNLETYDWLADIPGSMAESEYVEVLFKNTRKGYYRNSQKIPLSKGDTVAVESNPGHDIGVVSLTGYLAELRMKRTRQKAEDIKRVFRIAKPGDLEKFREAKAREEDTMIRARKIAESLHLNMKIGDVEYQGDGNKAIFYYIADERVDFRQLIKVLAETFRIRVEMKQIGARQEAGRIGGIGPCGRPLCCASWMSNFISVATSAARYQDISLNPQKLAGQCAKLKCCLNFEIDNYIESVKQLPSKDIRLETSDSTYFHFKTDIFKKLITYSTDKHLAANLVTIPASRAFEVMEMNRRGEKPLVLLEETDENSERNPFADILDQGELTRFDKKNKKKKKSGNGKSTQPQPQSQPQQNAQPQGNPQTGNKNGEGNNKHKKFKPKQKNGTNNKPGNDNKPAPA